MCAVIGNWPTETEWMMVTFLGGGCGWNDAHNKKIKGSVEWCDLGKLMMLRITIQKRHASTLAK